MIGDVNDNDSLFYIRIIFPPFPFILISSNMHYDAIKFDLSILMWIIPLASLIGYRLTPIIVTPAISKDELSPSIYIIGILRIEESVLISISYIPNCIPSVNDIHPNLPFS